MDKDRVIGKLRRDLDKAEDDLEYNIRRKEELKEDIQDLQNRIDDLEKKLENTEDK